ncbi:hypothetical protein [Streptomyces sp. NPDC002172]
MAVRTCTDPLDHGDSPQTAPHRRSLPAADCGPWPDQLRDVVDGTLSGSGTRG